MVTGLTAPEAVEVKIAESVERLSLAAVEQDEEAVSAFLLGKIGFSDIPAIVLETLGHFSGRATSGSIEEILHFDVLAREFAKRILNRAKGG